MRVISASRRTDIPAFYSRWLLNRLRAGYCHVANPYSRQVYRVGLTSDEVAALALFTRDPRPLLRHLPGLLEDGYRIYTHVTVNGYPRSLEARSPFLPRATAAIRDLATVIGRENVVWRYDPIVLTPETPEGFHVARFAGIAAALDGAAGECTISFVDRYRKTERNMREAGLRPDWDDTARQSSLAAELKAIADEHGIHLVACCEGALADAGVGRGACLDASRIASMRPDLDLRLKPAATRTGCGCAEATDIGMYDTCAFGCVYCYATAAPAAGFASLREHDPNDSILHRPPELVGVDLDAVAVEASEPDARKRAPRLFD